MRIVVLVKPVPDPASAGERLGPDSRLDRAAVPAVVNGNDEYVLEAALKLVEASAVEGEITLLSMAPTERPRDAAQGAGDGRASRRPRDRPGAGRLMRGLDREGPGGGASDARIRHGVRGRRRLRRRRRDRAGGGGRSSRAAVSLVGRADRTRSVDAERARPAHQRDRLRPAGGAVPGRHQRDPGAWRAALPIAQGDHGRARQGDRHAIAGGPGRGCCRGGRCRGDHHGPRQPEPPARGATEIVRGTPDEGAARIVDFLVERRII